MDLHRLSTAEFRRHLAAAGIRRFFLVWDEDAGAVRASHAELAPLAELLSADRRDFDRHEAIFGQLAPDSGLLQAVFVHRTCRGQAAGGVRLWRYPAIEDFLRDGLRLARGMTHKNALAGLWWGGGKGVIAAEEPAAAVAPERRRRIYEEYGELITSVRGCYVTAEDVGTSVDDMAAIFSRTRFTTCIPPALGGSGNPSAPTARGVLRGMQAALAHRGVEGGSLAGKTVAMQGLGNVGEPLVELLRRHGAARVVGTDIDADRCATLNRRFAAASAGDAAGADGSGRASGFVFEARAVGRDDLSIVGEPADIFAPCATGGVLSPRTIPRLGASIVCGAANNQLEDPERDDLLLHERGVLYMPDFLVNRMGIVNCADEQYGYVGGEDPRMAQHLGSGDPAGGGDTWENSIYNLSLAILGEAGRRGEPPARVALRMAEQRSRELHPLWSHRGAAIVRSLTRGAGAGEWITGA